MPDDEITSGHISCVVGKINKYLHRRDRNYHGMGLFLIKCTRGKGPEYERRFIREVTKTKNLKCRKSTVYNCYAVVRFFPEYTPNDPLSFSHHVELTRLDHEWERRDFKKAAIEEKWSVRELAAKVREYLDETASVEKRLKKCLACLRGSWELLHSLDGGKLWQVAKTNVISAAVAANMADEVLQKAKEVAKNAREYSDKVKKQWEEQLVARQAHDQNPYTIPADVGLEGRDYRLIGVQKALDCKRICFPKENPQTSLFNIFRAAKCVLQGSGCPDVRLQYRAKVWATRYSHRKNDIQFGERCLEEQFGNDEGYRRPMYERFGAKPGLEYVGLTVLEEATHAIVRKEAGARVRPHGQEFRVKLQEMYEKAFPVVMAILRDGQRTDADSDRVPAEPPGSSDEGGFSADKGR